MLIQFNFKNFRSFREEATLDLSATKMTEFSVTIGREKILPVAAIYGANASGKSNIYSAFEYMAEYVVDSFKYGDEEEKFEEYRPTPFLFDSTSADAEKCGFKDYMFVDSFEEAVLTAAKIAESGEAVLLSPACASWDMFPSYEVRGEKFKEIVNSL